MTLQKSITPRMIFISQENKELKANITSFHMGLTPGNKWDPELAAHFEFTFSVPANKDQWQKLHRQLRMLFSPFTYETLYDDEGKPVEVVQKQNIQTFHA